MFTKRTKYFLQHTPSIFTHAIIFYILYETRCKIYHFIHFKQPTIDNTQRKNSKIHAYNTNYMLLLNMIKKTRHIFKKMEQMTIIASCTCMRKKNSKQLDPRCTVFCDYRIPVHVYKTSPRGKHCTHTTSHNVCTINSITFLLMISI